MAAHTVTPQELGQILDIASKALVPLGQGFNVAPILAKLVGMANQQYPIGALVPEATTESPYQSVPTGT